MCIRELRVQLHLIDVSVREFLTSVTVTLDCKVVGHLQFSAVQIRNVTLLKVTGDLL